MTTPHTREPHTQQDVLQALADAQTTWTAYAGALPLAAFFQAPAPGRWSPAGHLRHLTLTHRRITQGLTLPRSALRVMFGQPTTRRTYPEMVRAYQAALAAGASAPERYVPAPDTVLTEATRAEVLRDFAGGAEALRVALGHWPDAALDTHAVRHDLLGRVSGRELAFFTLYHDHHHLRGVQAALETS